MMLKYNLVSKLFFTTSCLLWNQHFYLYTQETATHLHSEPCESKFPSHATRFSSI